MFTINYKGWYIHGHFDRDEVKIQSPDRRVWMLRRRSVHAAKCYITRHQHD